jgi:diacylglycerol kinase family enzyme
MSHANITNVGTFRDRKVEFSYDPDFNGGTLTISREDYAESISNNNIVGVIDRSSKDDAADRSRQILHISNASESTLDSPGKECKLESIRATNLPQAFVDANSISPRINSLSPPRSDTPVHSSLFVIISTLSGTGGAQQYFDEVIKPTLAAIDIPESAYHVERTSSNSSVLDFTGRVLRERANAGIPQTILLLSGDGGIVDIVNVLSSSPRSDRYVKPAIGLVAMGTGNAFANSTGLNKDSTRGLRHFLRGEPHRIPTFTATFSSGSELLVDEGRRTEPLTLVKGGTGVIYGAVVCSWALHASLVADSDTTELRKHGSQRFQMAANDLLTPADGSPPHAYKGKITLYKQDDSGHETQQILDSHEHMYILATMVSNLEEKLTISPHSKPLDGQIRLLHFAPTSSAEVMRILGLAFQDGQHITDEAVGYDDIVGMRIDFDEADGRWRRVCVDGKIVRVGEGGWVEVRKNDLDVVDIIADLRS